jgi:hypothetical protein
MNNLAITDKYVSIKYYSTIIFVVLLVRLFIDALPIGNV